MNRSCHAYRRPVRSMSKAIVSPSRFSFGQYVWNKIQLFFTVAFFISLTFFSTNEIFGQCANPCTIDFQNDGTFFSPTPFTDIAAGADIDIVAGVSQTSLTGQTFDILDASSSTCGVGTDGTDDYTLDFVLEPYFDVYGGGTLPSSPTGNDAGHNIVHSASGFTGSNATGTNSTTTNTSTGDVSCYNITVKFTTPQDAQDVNVTATSINTAGEAFESTSIIFFDGTCTPYGTATYNGFWNGAPQGSNGGSNTTMVNPMSNIYTVTGTGVFIAADPGTVDVGNGTNGGTATDPVAENSGPNDSPVVNASTDAGLSATAQVSGYVFRVCLEDVAITAVDDASTTTSVAFTSTLNSFDVCLAPVVASCPADLTTTFAPRPIITQSTCTTIGGTLANGTVTAPTDSCPTGSTLQYSIDNGVTWLTTLPAYNQSSPITILTRCECDSDMSITSIVCTTVTIPGTCPTCDASITTFPANN